MIDGQMTFQWEQLARRQKIYIAAGALAILIVIGCCLWDSLRSRMELRVYETEARKARIERDDALEAAQKIASQIRVREEELSKVEQKRDEKKGELKSAADRVSRDRAEYERAVRDRVTNPPSTDDLCRQLAAAGHPCYPR